MKEILFRGKSLDNGEWVEGYLFLDKDNAFILKPAICGERHGFQFNKVFKNSVSQYIGLRDKNGKCIFEGDIVKSIICDKTYEVCFDEFNLQYKGFEKYGARTFNYMGYQKKIEVVGNKWDNPKLLK